MPVGAIISDADGNLLQTNAAGQAILGGTVRGTVASPERPYSTHYPDGTPLPPEDLPLMHALKKGRVVRDFEVLIRRPEGDERTILAGAAPVLGDGGQIVGGITVFQDITELMEAQHALRDSEQKLGKLFEILPVGISVLDQSRNVVKANPALSSILNLSED
jgi:PAS domain-containing protein